MKELKEGIINKIHDNNIFLSKEYTIKDDEISMKDLFKKSEEKVKIRLLHFENMLNSKKNINEIVIHVHGGGFIGNSSRSHQFYTRKLLILLFYYLITQLFKFRRFMF